MRKSVKKEEEIIENLLEQVKKILLHKENDENENDKIIKIMIKYIFTEETGEALQFPNINRNREKQFFNLLKEFINIINTLFILPKNERNILYSTLINDISNNTIASIIRRMNQLQDYEIKSNNPKQTILYNKIFNLLDKKIYTLYDYISITIYNISFSLKNKKVYNLLLLSYINQYYIIPNKIKPIKLEESKIDINNDLCLNLLIDLFEKKNENFEEKIIFAILIIKFYLINELTTKVDYKLIKQAIKNSYNSIKNISINEEAMFMEKIVLLFCNELKKLILNKNKNAISQIKGKEKTSVKNDNTIKKDLLIKNQNFIEEKSHILNQKEEGKRNNLIEKNVNNNKKSNIGDKNLSHKNIYEIYYKIVNMKELDKRKLNEQFDEIKNLLKFLMDDNKELKDDNKKLKDNIIQLNDNNKKMKDKIDALEKDVQIVKEENYEIKTILYNIQSRDLCKSFLNCFNCYLKNDDKAKISKDPKKKGEIIIKRIKLSFPKHINNKKFKLIINLIEQTSNSRNYGNDRAHSFQIEYFKEKIKEYKKDNNIDTLDEIGLLCFLFAIGIKKEFLQETYNFMKSMFTSDLELKNWRNGLIEQSLSINNEI